MTPVITTRRSGFSVWPIAIGFNALLLAACVFIVTQEVKRHEAGVQELNREILAEQQTLRVLDAEWAYLTRPQRLEDLLAMKANGGEMPEDTAETKLTDVEPVQSAPQKTAAIEPSAGVATVAVKPAAKAAEPAQKPATVHKAAVKTEPKKPAAPKVAKSPEKDIVWPIKRPAAVQLQAKIASYPAARAGVAKPILE